MSIDRVGNGWLISPYKHSNGEDWCGMPAAEETSDGSVFVCECGTTFICGSGDKRKMWFPSRARRLDIAGHLANARAPLQKFVVDGAVNGFSSSVVIDV